MGAFRELECRGATQTCSCCGVIPISSPKSRADLGIRQWRGSVSGSEHDRYLLYQLSSPHSIQRSLYC